MGLYKSPITSLLSVLDRFMCSLSLFIPSHSLPLSLRAMTERRARDDRETKKRTKSLSLLHISKKSCIFAAEIGVLWPFAVKLAAFTRWYSICAILINKSNPKTRLPWSPLREWHLTLPNATRRNSENVSLK